MNVKVVLKESQIKAKVKNDRFGRFLANEWKRLIDSYTPRDTGNLEGTVSILPFKIHYKSPYATYVYHGRNMKFQKKNPYSTYEWDKAAENAGQKSKLCRTANAALKSGQF